MSLLRVVRLSEPSGPAIDVPRPRGPRGTYLPNARQYAGLVRAAEDILTFVRCDEPPAANAAHAPSIRE